MKKPYRCGCGYETRSATVPVCPKCRATMKLK